MHPAAEGEIQVFIRDYLTGFNVNRQKRPAREPQDRRAASRQTTGPGQKKTAPSGAVRQLFKPQYYLEISSFETCFDPSAPRTMIR